MSPAAAHRRMEVARLLASTLPATRDALARGEIGYLHVLQLTDAVRELEDDPAQAVEARALSRAGQQTVGEFRHAVRRAVLTCDPLGSEQRHQLAVKTREVWKYAEPTAWPLSVLG